MTDRLTAESQIQIRSISELDLGDVVRIAERTRGSYQPDLWEDRMVYYLRRDPDGSVVAEVDGRVAGFMLGDVRGGEFGIEEPSGWIEVIGVDPDYAGRGVGRALAEAILERFRERGVRAVRTVVDVSMPDIEKFFVSRGFTPDTLRPFVKRLPDRGRTANQVEVRNHRDSGALSQGGGEVASDLPARLRLPARELGALLPA